MEELTRKDASKFVTALQLKGSRTEILFYLTLFVTIVHAGLILWDLFTMTPAGSRLFGLVKPNDITASPHVRDLYLVLLASYAGYKEFKHWKLSDDAPVPESEANMFRRGEAIIAFWVLLAVVSASLEAMHIISRMPNELMRTTMQVIAVMLGSYGSRTIRNGRKKNSKAQEADNAVPVNEADTEKQEAGPVRLSDSHRKIVADYLNEHEFINRESCMEATGLSSQQAYRLLTGMEEDGELEKVGDNKGTKYRRKG